MQKDKGYIRQNIKRWLTFSIQFQTISKGLRNIPKNYFNKSIGIGLFKIWIFGVSIDLEIHFLQLTIWFNFNNDIFARL